MAGVRASALFALVLTVAAPVRIGVTILGSPVSFPAGWLILGAEVLAAARPDVAGGPGPARLPVLTLPPGG